MTELVQEGRFALNPRIGKMTDLVTVEARPSLPHGPLAKADNAAGMNKIDKGIAHVASVAEIHAKVHKIVLSRVSLINHVNQHLLASEQKRH